MTRTRSKEPSIGRTRWITAAAILGVVVAGSAAIAANVGILHATERSEIGTLSATDSLLPAEQQAIAGASGDATSPPSTGSPAPAATTPADATSRTFVVDDAGSVTVVKGTDGLHLGGVATNPGWTGRLARSSPSTLVVSLTSGTRVLEFAATLEADGTLTGAVSSPSQPTATATHPTSVASTHGDDDDEDGHRSGDAHREADEHDGGEDDD
jgi:hypothetical protein